MSLWLRAQWLFWDTWRWIVGCKHPVWEPLEATEMFFDGERIAIFYERCTLCQQRRVVTD